MAHFTYEAVTAVGKTVKGVQEAPSAHRAEESLRSRGLHPLEVAAASGPEAAPEGSATKLRFRSRRADVTRMIRYLATLLGSGFTLDRALEAVAARVLRRDVAEATRAVRSAVRSGSELSEAMAEHAGIFPALSIGMIRAGERGGDLAPALERLADHLEREQELRSRLVSSLTYPAVMVLIGGIAVLVLVLYVLPRFVVILQDAGAALPATTSFILGASGFVGRWWPALLAGGLATGATAYLYLRSEAGRDRAAAAMLRMPIVGPLRRRVAAARFGRSLASLLESGLPILDALRTASESMGDPAAAAEVDRARAAVRDGESLTAAFAGSPAFPELFLEMVALGEEGGRLPKMLHRAATVAERELERRLERMVRLVEPALVVVFGGIVALIALSLLQAIYGVRLRAF